MKDLNIDFKELQNQNLEYFEENSEAADYDGCSYKFKGHFFIQRTSKVTPKKNGQFVTLWKRNDHGITCPMEFEESFDFVVIFCRQAELLGRFLFPKQLLLEKKYIRSTEDAKSGKRGFRVYPDWDQPKSSQAAKTQAWQLKYFKRSSFLEFKE